MFVFLERKFLWSYKNTSQNVYKNIRKHKLEI